MADCLYIKVFDPGNHQAALLARSRFNDMVENDEHLIWHEDVPDRFFDERVRKIRPSIPKKRIAVWIEHPDSNIINLTFDLDTLGLISIPFLEILDLDKRYKILQVAANLQSKIYDPFGILIDEDYLGYPCKCLICS